MSLLVLCNSQARDILTDPYANAYNKDDDGGHQDDDRKPRMTPHVFEGKYELDSLAAHLKLSYNYWLNTDDTSCFGNGGGTWKKAARLIVDTIKIQTVGTKDEGSNPPYLFARYTTVATDTLVLQKRGPVGRTIGLRYGIALLISFPSL
jgi:meiotically up-regulated gene 157 (Mug157) protein